MIKIDKVDDTDMVHPLSVEAVIKGICDIGTSPIDVNYVSGKI